MKRELITFCVDNKTMSSRTCGPKERSRGTLRGLWGGMEVIWMT